MSELKQGARVQTADGIKVMTDYLVQQDMVVTEDGDRIPYEDLIEVPRPKDPARLEEWLDGPDYRVIPRLGRDTYTKRCTIMSCSCPHCYRVYHTANGRVIDWKHFRDNDVCSCDTSCCAD